jgi:uncharacterized protein YdcH (DUF465 family)
MSIEKHDLIHEFPEFRETIHELKTSDRHFARLFEAYHDTDHEVRRIEEGAETTDDVYLEDLKKKRLSLKDELYQMLKRAAPAGAAGD